MRFKTASDMRKLVEEKEEENFPYDLYYSFMQDIEEDAKQGLTSRIYTFSTADINKDTEGFYNLKKDWNIVSKKLYELGFECSSNIQLYDPFSLDIGYYHITIKW